MSKRLLPTDDLPSELVQVVGFATGQADLVHPNAMYTETPSVISLRIWSSQFS